MKKIDAASLKSDFTRNVYEPVTPAKELRRIHEDCCAGAFTSVPVETIKRSGIYLSLLRLMKIRGNMQVSTPQIADLLNLKIRLIEADFMEMGIGRQTQFGFVIKSLIETLEERLGFQNYTEAFLVGAGKLGTSLMLNKNLGHTDLKIVAAFDIDPRKIGTTIGSVKVMSPEKICPLASRMHICMGIIATPAGQAQQIADMFVEAGTWSIWNFSADEIVVPPHVILQNTRIGEDLKQGYQYLVDQLRKLSKEKANRNQFPATFRSE